MLSKRELGFVVVLTASLFYAWWFSDFTIARYNNFALRPYDFGLFVQSVYSFAKHGLLLFNNVELGGASHFAVHNSPILLAVGEIYRFVSDPRTLLVLQSLFLGLAAVPLYALASERLGAELAIILSLSYLLNPAIHGINAFDFHPVSLGPFFILLTLYLIERGSLWWPVSLALALSVKEDSGLFAIAVGLHYLLSKRKKLGIALIVIGALWIIVSIKIVIPSFNPLGRYMYIGPYKYSLNTLLLDFYHKLLFTVAISVPTFFTHLLTPSGLLVSAILLLELWDSKFTTYTTLGYQYPYMLVPAIYFFSIIWLEKMKRRSEALANVFAILIALSTIVSLIVFDTVPLFKAIPYAEKVRGFAYHLFPQLQEVVTYRDVPSYQPHFANLERVLERIRSLPEGLPVALSDNLFPKAADRTGSFFWTSYRPWIIIIDYQFDNSDWYYRMVRNGIGPYTFAKTYKLISNFDDILVCVRVDKLGYAKGLLPWDDNDKRVLLLFFKKGFEGKPLYFYYSNVLVHNWPRGPAPSVPRRAFSGAMCFKGMFYGKVNVNGDGIVKVFINNEEVNSTFKFTGDGTAVILFSGVTRLSVQGDVKPVKALSLRECKRLAKSLYLRGIK